MNTKAAARSLIVMVAMAVALLAVAREAEAVTCNPLQLSPCLGAISASASPSSSCCDALKQQKPCLCQYYRDPSLSQYVNSPGARKVVSACHVTVQC